MTPIAGPFTDRPQANAGVFVYYLTHHIDFLYLMSTRVAGTSYLGGEITTRSITTRPRASKKSAPRDAHFSSAIDRLTEHGPADERGADRH